jgi:hypothetical protein
MGLCTFKNPQTGELVKANFPLHPMLVEFTREDSSTGQMETATFSSTYVQQLPELPALVVTEEATEEEISKPIAVVPDEPAAVTTADDPPAP